MLQPRDKLKFVLQSKREGTGREATFTHPTYTASAPLKTIVAPRGRIASVLTGGLGWEVWGLGDPKESGERSVMALRSLSKG